MKIAVLQSNPFPGDVEGNTQQLMSLIQEHRGQADLFVSSELALTGYYCRDLFSHRATILHEREALKKIIDFSQSLDAWLLVGHTEDSPLGCCRPLYNAASLIRKGQVIQKVFKQRIPWYDIFEEDRFFEPYKPSPEYSNIVECGEKRILVHICEDSWSEFFAYGVENKRKQKDIQNGEGNVDCVINLSASPFSPQKFSARIQIMRALTEDHSSPCIYVNCVGAQDEIIFDGQSFQLSEQGSLVSSAPAHKKCCSVFDLSQTQPKKVFDPYWAGIKEALVQSIKEYLHRSGFQKVVLGLSGGIDSAVCAALAVEALGSENVLGIAMPTAFNSAQSLIDAKDLSKSLGCDLRIIELQNLLKTAQRSSQLPETGLAFENLQSRCRALLLMACSNNENRLLLATGNKSEIAMGYSTLYGDMCGALSPLGDLYKTEVYGLAHYINHEWRLDHKTPPIPESTMSKSPSAELAPNQRDSDSLPDYAVLDALLFYLVENQGILDSPNDWKKILGDAYTVSDLERKMHSQEFKRQQAALIPKIHQRSFGKGWHWPVNKKI